jgi:hypothetical protein
MFTLDDCCRFYAEEVQFSANIASPELIAALTRAKRYRDLCGSFSAAGRNFSICFLSPRQKSPQC